MDGNRVNGNGMVGNWGWEIWNWAERDGMELVLCISGRYLKTEELLSS